MRELCFEADTADSIEEKLGYKHSFNVADDDIELVIDNSTVKVRFNSSKIAVADMLSHTLSRVNVKDINVKDADIEEIIRRLYKEGVADNA